MICDNISVKDGKLYFAGYSVPELAEKYGTPLYLLDESKIRENMRLYIDAMNRHFPAAVPLYASKALSFKGMYEIAKEEGMAVDVVSLGELAHAEAAGFPMEKIWFHGNAKTDREICKAMEKGIAGFVVDSYEELFSIAGFAKKQGIRQNVMLRVTPGIDPHTFEAVNTGKVDSKFGVPIETGQALDFVAETLSEKISPYVKLCGIHAHVGSQGFDSQVFYDMVDLMTAFLKEIKDKLGYEAEILSLGGGYGVRYKDSDPFVDIASELKSVAEHLQHRCDEQGIAQPFIMVEPGRSIVADAGMTVYTVQNVKNIKGYHSYVAVDGGMGDNPRYALYGAPYTVYKANGMDEPCAGEYQVVGRYCESGDVLQENVPLPLCRRGDIIAVCTTGAYNHSMASNYNCVARPPIVVLNAEGDYVAVRRETEEDLLIREI